ncbi:MAG: Hsp20/alpha crystallin family protein [Verrucomicrobiota bacterium]|nr:Hsp20/alpha crystallin family protein [Verrucomicrobiota bacterium]
MNRLCLPSFVEETDDSFIRFLKQWTVPTKSESVVQTGVTIAESEDAVTVEAPVLGVNKENIQITYEKGFLLVKAEEEEEKVEEKKRVKYHLKASRQYVYHIPIPTRIDEQVSPEASYKDGILRVKFLKSKSARPQKIAIQ